VAAAEAKRDDSHESKSILQAKLTRLAILIGYVGMCETLLDTISKKALSH